MSASITPTATANDRPRASSGSGSKGRRRSRTSLLARGESMMWLTGGALALCLVMITGLLALIVFQGVSTFWPTPVVKVTLVNGQTYMGEITRSESFPLSDELIATYDEDTADRARRQLEGGNGTAYRRLMRTGNFDLTNTHFRWIDGFATVSDSKPEWAVVLERRAWGRFYGFPTRFVIDGKTVADTPGAVWELFQTHHSEVSARFDRIYKLQRYDFGRVHARTEKARLQLREVEMSRGKTSPAYIEASKRFDEEVAQLGKEQDALAAEIGDLTAENGRFKMVMSTVTGQDATIALSDIVRAYPANQLSIGGKVRVYLSRWWEFLTDDPREANSEGGVWPAIVGTVIMTLLMSLAVVPFGVLAALYLREYAKAGPLISSVRIAVNNLAGVPSIVFGVFGLGFFCYIVGASIDQVFFATKLPNPTYGKGGVIWASLTLALLTLPVVVVATEEALAAVPGSMREGSYACGASKWQTVRRIVLPRAMPGIMTGFILAMARGAGEVAPLMLVGAVKLAPDLPIDGVLPFLHPERSFMHLGFHIYDVGFQSQNSEAAKPMVFTTTLLLITIIAALNVAAVWIRTRLRRRFVSSKF